MTVGLNPEQRVESMIRRRRNGALARAELNPTPGVDLGVDIFAANEVSDADHRGEPMNDAETIGASPG